MPPPVPSRPRHLETALALALACVISHPAPSRGGPRPCPHLRHLPCRLLPDTAIAHATSRPVPSLHHLLPCTVSPAPSPTPSPTPPRIVLPAPSPAPSP